MKKEKHERYEPEILVLTDDEGNTSELEILDYVIFEGKQYVVLYPVDAGDDEPVIIMYCKKEEYFFINDQRVINGVYELFLEGQRR